MFIRESTVHLQSSHHKTTVEKETASLRAWVDGAEGPSDLEEPSKDGSSFQRVVDRVKLSAESLEMAHGNMHSKKMRNSSMPDDAALMKKLQQCAQGQCASLEKTSDEDDTIVADPKLNLMKQLVEALSGKEVHVYDASKHDKENNVPDSESSDSNVPRSAEKRDFADGGGEDVQVRPAREGWGVSYDYSKTTVEHEQTRFSAEGVVRTNDGKEINFSAGLQMERERIEVTSFQFRAGDAQLVDPLVLNFDGNAAALTEQKVDFDLNSDGVDESISFVAGNSGFLVYDNNGDGIVNNGSELFGPSSGNGFAELAQHDDDNNGWIDEADAVYEDLRIWQGSPDSAALSSLKSRNVGAIYLGSAATPFENRGQDGTLLGQTAATGVFLSESGQVGTVQQIDLVS